MNPPSPSLPIQHVQASFVDQVAVGLAIGLAVALFLTVGRVVLGPSDPLAPVSVFSTGAGALMLIESAALAGVATCLATLLAGRRAMDVGILAAVVGLAVYTLFGGTTEQFLLDGADAARRESLAGTGSTSGVEHALALRFLVEALGWWLVVAVSLAVSALVYRWCCSSPTSDGAEPSQAMLPAGFDIPRVPQGLTGIASTQRTPVAMGLRHALIVGGVGLAAMMIFSAGLGASSIKHGQVFFVVGMSAFVGEYFAFRTVPVRSALWSILGVVLIVFGGYLWSAVRPDVGGTANIPSSHFMRVLPTQFVSVGVAGAILGFWYSFWPDSLSEPEPPTPKPSRSRTKRR